MACEVAQPSQDDRLTDSFSMGDQMDNDFEKLVQFNNGNFIDNSSVNPQVLSNPPSPAASLHDQQPMNPYDVTFASPTSPYFQSIEQQPTPKPFNQASSLRHEFRRSVSEPPGGHPIPGHPHNQGQPQMVFHRDQHWLGHQTHNTHRLKSLPRGKQNYRAQPYVVHSKIRAAPVHQQHRYPLRRTHTQPMPLFAPTSVPMMTAPPHAAHANHPYPAALNQSFPSPSHGPQRDMLTPMPSLPEQATHMTSRICTPAPEGVQTSAQQSVIDSALTAPMTPLPTPATSVGVAPKAITLQMTPEELKAIIKEAVQKAFVTLGAGEKVSTAVQSGTDITGAECEVQTVRQSTETAEAEPSSEDNIPADFDGNGSAAAGDLTTETTAHPSIEADLDNLAWVQSSLEEIDALFSEANDTSQAHGVHGSQAANSSIKDLFPGLAP